MKKVLISIFTLIFIISIFTVVNAASGSITATPSANQVTRGSTFTVSLSATSNYNITGFQSGLSYDTSKLTMVKDNPLDTSGDNEIAVPVNTQIKSGEIYTMKFKVSDNAALGDTTISITNGTLAVINDSTEENVTSLNTTATVKIIADDTTVDNNSTSDTSSTTDDSGSSDSSSSSSKSSSSSSTSSKSNSDSSSDKKLPQTGAEVISIVGIAALSVIAIISYVSYKKYRNI